MSKEPENAKRPTLMQMLLSTELLQVVTDTDSGLEFLMDRGGFAYTHEEFAELFSSLSVFYATVTPEEIAKYNEDRMAGLQERPSPTPKAVVPQPGFLYLIRVDGVHKIGKTKDLKSRLASYKKHSQQDFEIIGTMPVADMGSAEEELLAMFSSERIDQENPKSEWFRLSPDSIARIKRLMEAL